MSQSQEFAFKELQEKLLTLKSLQVKEELAKLNAAQLDQLSNSAKEKLNDLKTGDASFANEKEISNQRYLIEVFNARQIDLAQKEYLKSDYLQLRNSGVTGQALSDANNLRNELSDRLRNLTDQQMANRVESGYGGQETPMSKVLSEINSRDIENANGESISDADLKSILKEESVQLESLKSMPDAKAEDLKSQTELLEKLNNILKQREQLADANNPAVKSSFAAHPEDKKIEDLKQKYAVIQSNGLSKASSEYRAAANELSDARRDYQGNDPAIKLHGALIRDRELNAASSQLSYQTFYGSLTGADAFRNDVEIARIASQRSANLAVIDGLVKEKDYKLAQREAAEAKLAASTAQNKTTAPVLPQQPDLSTAASTNSPSTASATLADKAAQDRSELAKSELPNVDAAVPGKPAQTTNAPDVGKDVANRPSFDEQIKAQREQQRANNQASNLAAGNANATPSSADIERSQKLSEAVDASAKQREAAKIQAEQQQALSTDPALKP